MPNEDLNLCEPFHSRCSSEGRKCLHMGDDKPFPEVPIPREAYVVTFDGPSDPWSPLNWPLSTRLWTAVVVCYGTFVSSLDSALFAPGGAQASSHFGVGAEVGKLGTSLYVLGFAFGPILWAPGSELIGRRLPLIVGMLGCSIFSLGSATSKDIQTLIICRFFAGVFGASPLCVVPGVLSDTFDDLHRSTAISVYALTVFVGPFAAPWIGGFVATSSLGWRWTLYLPAILGFVSVIFLCLIKETYPRIILVEKAAKIRQQTANFAIHAEHEREEVNAKEIVREYFTRPLRMLATEPIVLLVSLYMSFIYGLVYALLEAYPYVFEDIHGMGSGLAGLPFIALILGVAIAACFVNLQHRRYLHKVSAGKVNSRPEAHLFPSTIGAFVFTLGIFWFAWTGFTKSIHWMVPTASGLFTGFGILCIFLPCFNYLVEAYLPLTASVVAANVMLRSSFAASFPLFASQMFQDLMVQWAGTLLGCVALALTPIPFAFRAYGKILRLKSKLLPNDPAIGC